MKKVIVGMSGGVDSAVAAFLLKKAGYDVTGVTLRIWQSDTGEESRCCEMDDARRISNKIGIPYYPLNCADIFKDKVINPFINEYLCGRTPNPCIECNRYVKWDRMLYYAKIFHADYVATGHYAHVIRLENGRYTVKTALHAEKDQTYMLYKLTQEQLAHTLMPLGDMSKEEVRKIAADEGLFVAGKPDSQEICFVTDGNYADYIREHAESEIPGEGNFVDEDGKILGRHKGIINYTVGQRKGLGIALRHPAYVKSIDAAANEVVLAGEESARLSEIRCRDLNFLSIEPPKAGAEFECHVKVRYHHKPQKAVVTMETSDVARVSFDTPVKLCAPGQSAVFYDENACIIGGGIII